MPTEKQLAANRANAQISTGPRSAEGKAVSSRNALKHGGYAVSTTEPAESAAELEKLAAELLHEHGPANCAERFTVDDLIYYEWSLRRWRRVEAGLWDLASPKFARIPGAKIRAARTFLATGKQLAQLQKLIVSCRRNQRLALEQLRLLKASRPTPPTGPGGPALASQTKDYTITSTSGGFVWYNRQIAPKAPPAGPTAAVSIDSGRKLPEAA